MVDVTGELNLRATLIVCPVSLIDQWRREIESKTEPKLDVLLYYGSGRTRNPYAFANYDGNDNTDYIIIHLTFLNSYHHFLCSSCI